MFTWKKKKGYILETTTIQYILSYLLFEEHTIIVFIWFCLFYYFLLGFLIMCTKVAGKHQSFIIEDMIVMWMA